jgi:hypothetical protein
VKFRSLEKLTLSEAFRGNVRYYGADSPSIATAHERPKSGETFLWRTEPAAAKVGSIWTYQEIRFRLYTRIAEKLGQRLQLAERWFASAHRTQGRG